MGTLVEVTSPDPRAKGIVFSEFGRLEALFNLLDPDSELSRLNEAGVRLVSADLFNILKEAQRFYKVSGGAFDATIGPVSLVWKKAMADNRMPSEEEIRRALQRVGFDYVYLDAKTMTVHLLKSGARIDLGGIAKGYALDRAVALLRRARVTSALVNAGGNIYCLGKNGRRPWVVGVRDPRRPGVVRKRLELEDKAVATSGDYEQFFVYRDKRYSHIIDPRTGSPADSGVVSVTVVVPDGLTADALSTALFVLGRQKGADLLKGFPEAQASGVTNDEKLFNF